MPGARAVSEDTLNKKHGQYLQIPSGTNLFDMRDGKLMSKGSLAEERYKLEMNKHSDNRMLKETTRNYKVKEWKSEVSLLSAEKSGMAKARVRKRESADGSLSQPTTNDRVSRQRLSQAENGSLSRPTRNDRVSRQGRRGR